MTLCGFTSLCMIPREWQKSNAYITVTKDNRLIAFNLKSSIVTSQNNVLTLYINLTTTFARASKNIIRTISPGLRFKKLNYLPLEVHIYNIEHQSLKELDRGL